MSDGPADGPTAGEHPAGDVGEVGRAVVDISRRLTAHAGGIELVAVRDGTARLRFTGACTGCPARPLTFATTVRPALQGLAGVERVVVEGVRLDPEQEARLAAWQDAGRTWALRVDDPGP